MGFGPVAIVIVFVFLCMTSCMALAWFTMKPLFNKDPALRIMGVFGCTQKTIALGIPLILSIFGGSPNIGLYTLPILIWHPMQLVVGSFFVPKLQKFLASENERLSVVKDDVAQVAVSNATTTLPSVTTLPSATAVEASEEYV
jgi:solute carrier family 10 (sodium/bile acid cotransporter), member 7